MAGPSKTGALIFAKDVAVVAEFYESVLEMQRCHSDPQHVVLETHDTQLVIHAIPPDIARSIVIETPPAPRIETAIKPFFSVSELDSARERAQSLGGNVWDDAWDGPGFVACNANDPEGNVFQIREFLSA